MTTTTTTTDRIQTRAAAYPRDRAAVAPEAEVPTGLKLFIVLTVLFFVLVAVTFSMASQVGA